MFICFALALGNTLFVQVLSNLEEGSWWHDLMEHDDEFDLRRKTTCVIDVTLPTIDNVHVPILNRPQGRVEQTPVTPQCHNCLRSTSRCYFLGQEFDRLSCFDEIGFDKPIQNSHWKVSRDQAKDTRNYRPLATTRCFEGGCCLRRVCSWNIFDVPNHAHLSGLLSPTKSYSCHKTAPKHHAGKPTLRSSRAASQFPSNKLTYNVDVRPHFLSPPSPRKSKGGIGGGDLPPSLCSTRSRTDSDARRLELRARRYRAVWSG